MIERNPALGRTSHHPEKPAPTVQRLGAPEPPKHLGEAGREVWARIWGPDVTWLHPVTDLAATTRYCELSDERATLREIVAREGYVATGNRGQTKTHPAVTQLRTVERSLIQLEQELALTPTGRGRIGAKPPRQPSKLDEFLARINREADEESTEDKTWEEAHPNG